MAPTRIKNSISISVVCYDSPWGQLENLLGSLLKAIIRARQVYDLSIIQIYLIDNSDYESIDPVALKARKIVFANHQVNLACLHGHGNIGYGGAHNLVLKNLTSRFHLMLNPDVIVNEDSLLRSFKILSDDPEISVLSPNAIDFAGEKQHLCKRYPSVLLLLIRGFAPSILRKAFARKLEKYEMRDLPETNVSEGIPLISGCFMFVRTQLLIKINGFDERYFLYFEDFDLSLRIANLGKLVFAPEVRISHGGGNTSKKGLRHFYYFFQSGCRFFNSHGWSFF